MNTTKKIWIAIIAVVAIIAVIGVSMWLARGEGDNSEQNLTQPTEQSSSSPNESSESDTPHSGVSSDAFGRRVVTPSSQQGVALTEQVHQGAEICSPQEQVRAPEQIEIQRTHNVMTVWSVSDGPSDASELIPEGYSHTPTGAALAAWNLFSLTNAGGEVTATVFADYMGLSEQESVEYRAVVEADGGSEAISQRQGSEALLVPDAHRILSCADDLIVVELAKPLGADSSGITDTYWQVLRFPMIWKDDKWEINGKDDNSAVRQTLTDLGSGWTRWEF
uniref:hypothetical protein n=1 Tax=Corynebacterium glutamicum TaxID=1718 RepID=UPI00095A6051|nr:hypothetical protein [Corynebacterium glutamicum]